MNETLLLALLISLWILLRSKRDWYVVELRTCFDEKLCTDTFSSPPNYGFDKLYLSAYHLVIDRKSLNGASLLHKDGGRVNITQTVFTELTAASLHFENMKKLFPYMEGFHKVYLWRIVSRSRRKAIVLPPDKYIACEGEALQEFPPHLWFSPQINEEQT